MRIPIIFFTLFFLANGTVFAEHRKADDGAGIPSPIEDQLVANDKLLAQGEITEEQHKANIESIKLQKNIKELGKILGPALEELKNKNK